MPPGRQHSTHVLQPGTAHPSGGLRACLWEPGSMTSQFLVARLHVDLQRVSSAVCSPAGR